jgi:TRAP-type C4-dicarboxylate transport system permease large subunit
MRQPSKGVQYYISRVLTRCLPRAAVETIVAAYSCTSTVLAAEAIPQVFRKWLFDVRRHEMLDLLAVCRGYLRVALSPSRRSTVAFHPALRRVDFN